MTVKTENIEQDALESEVEETEEEQGKTNNHKNIRLKNHTNNNKKHVKKLKIFDYLSSEQDAREIGTEINLYKTASLFNSIDTSSAIERTASNFLNANKKVQKIKKLIKTGE